MLVMAAFGPRPVPSRPLPSLRASFGAARNDGRLAPARLTGSIKEAGHQNRAMASPTLARKRLRVSGVDTFIAWCARNTAGLCMPML